MTRIEQSERAKRLRAWHHEPQLLVLPNAWDVASAVALARVPGCRALATTSGGVARSLGFEDGAAPRDEMLRVAARIAAAVDIPVSADLERGYDDPPAVVRAAWDAGIVGANIEDSVGGGHPVSVDEQVELLRVVRAAAPELVLNARIDTFLRGSGGVEETVERGRAYIEAGADCVFPITIADRGDIAAVVEGVRSPVAVMAVPGLPPLDELERLGVARFTWGSGLAQTALAAAAELAQSATQAARRDVPREARRIDQDRASTVRRFLSPGTLATPFGYSHAVDVAAGRLIFVSGQVPLDRDGRLIGEGDFDAQTRQVFTNLGAALEAAGASWADVVKLNYFLVDVTNVASVRSIRDEFVDTDHPPASTLVEVSRLFRDDVLIEIDAVAAVEDMPHVP